MKVRKKTDSYFKIKVNEFERKLITETFIEFNYNQAKTAEFLGINRNTLRSRLVEYGLIIERAYTRRSRGLTDNNKKPSFTFTKD